MTVRIRVAWWLRPYLGALAFFCNVMGAEPAWDKLERVVRRAIRLEVHP